MMRKDRCGMKLYLVSCGSD